MIQALLQVHPAGAGVASSNGALPLHYALKANGHGEVTQELFQGHPESAAIAAAWENIRRQDQKCILCFSGFGSVQRTHIWAALEKFGEIEHLHHVEFVPSNSFVMFASEDDALAAYNAHLNDQGEVKLKPGMPLHFDVDVNAPGSRVFETPLGLMAEGKSISSPARRGGYYTYGTTQESGYFILQHNKDCEYHYYYNLKEAVKAMKPLLADHEAWLGRCEKAEEDKACVREVAYLQLQLSDALELRPGLEEQIGMWKRTMQMIYDKQYEMHVDRFASTLLELVSFCDQVFHARQCLPAGIASAHAGCCLCWDTFR